jgi:hypothetical protein
VILLQLVSDIQGSRPPPLPRDTPSYIAATIDACLQVVMIGLIMIVMTIIAVTMK